MFKNILWWHEPNLGWKTTECDRLLFVFSLLLIDSWFASIQTNDFLGSFRKHSSADAMKDTCHNIFSYSSCKIKIHGWEALFFDRDLIIFKGQRWKTFLSKYERQNLNDKRLEVRDTASAICNWNRFNFSFLIIPFSARLWSLTFSCYSENVTVSIRRVACENNLTKAQAVLDGSREIKISWSRKFWAPRTNSYANKNFKDLSRIGWF